MTTCFSLLGPTLDNGFNDRRWDRWRPSVALLQHDDLLIDRVVLLYQKRFNDLARVIMADMQQVSPETTVVPQHIEFRDPWDFSDVYGALFDVAASYDFAEDEDYLVHITTGTHVAQICCFLLTETRHFPARLIQTSPPQQKRLRGDTVGKYDIIDLDLSRYDALASRFADQHQQAVDVLTAGIATENPAFRDMIADMEHVALHSRAPMLLDGATGVGKRISLDGCMS